MYKIIVLHIDYHLNLDIVIIIELNLIFRTKYNIAILKVKRVLFVHDLTTLKHAIKLRDSIHN